MKRLFLIFLVLSSLAVGMDRPYAFALVERSAQQKKLLLGQELLGIVIGITRNPRSRNFMVPENTINNIKSLLAQGANANAVTVDSQKNALYYAIEIPNIEIIKLLIMHGADLNKKDREGDTPLHYIGWMDTADVREFAELLIENGADVDAQNMDGITPLMNAVKWKNVPLVRLLANGVHKLKEIENLEKNDKTYYSLLPLVLRKAILEHLKIKANPCIKNKSGATALDIAKEGLRQAQFRNQNDPESLKIVFKWNQRILDFEEIIKILEAATANYALPQQNVSQQQLQPQINPQPAAKQKSWWQFWGRS